MVWAEETEESCRTEARNLLTILSRIPLLILAVGVSCSPIQSHYVQVEQALAQGNPEAADALVEKHRDEYGKKSRVLYAMDRGMLLHLSGRYQKSTEFLENAERMIEDLYTRRIGSQTAALLINDNVLPYEGEHFEQVLIHVIMALNYAYQGLFDDALVEARKIDHKLNVLSDRAENTYAYTQDAFARYLTGLLFESRGELNDAFVAYRLAYNAFQAYQEAYGTPIPSLLGKDLLRLSGALNLEEEFEEYQQDFPETTWQSIDEVQQQGELVLISFHGRAPKKANEFIDIPFSMQALTMVLATHNLKSSKKGRIAQNILFGLTGDVFSVALPKFVPQPSKVSYTEIVLIGGGTTETARTILMEDVTEIARQDLKDRLVWESARAVARAALKFAFAKAAERGVTQATENEDLGRLVGFITKLAGSVTEQADTRSWRTLPDEIQLARVRVPPGIYELHVRHVGRNGRVLDEKTLPSVEILAGKLKILSHRTVL
ncbi:MAG TPA: hypothetical protein EYO65_04325 [Nitrospirales bacterium]|nr:hypothetical protein [Nitrospirales bacterium]HIC04734.1 hypothetical protein [Nitrospirales bacterium]